MTQAQVLFDYWTDDIKWFVVGGTADGDEAQTVAARYPEVKCIGFEPNMDFVKQQNEKLKFPGEVYPCALWSDNELRMLITPQGATPRSASVYPFIERPDMGGKWTPGITKTVPARALDSLSWEYGPFENVALWIDIEGAELEALLGASQLLQNRQIKLINLEAYAHLQFPDINRLLTRRGFVLQKVWNIGTVAGRDAQDYIYMLED
jgi:FkbM family methyltransferase